MRTRSAALGLAMLLVAACGDADGERTPRPTGVADSTAPATAAATDDLAALVGPWRPAPIEVSDALTDNLASACRDEAGDELGVDVGALPVGLVDARGQGRATLILADDHAAVVCEARIDAAGIGETLDEPPARLAPDSVDPIGDDQIAIVGYTAAGEGGESLTRLIGRVGGRTVDVVATFDDGTEIHAATANGWFAAWWPGTVDAATIAAIDRENVAFATTTGPAGDLEPRVGVAAWWLNPRAPLPDADATTIFALITERACASGASPEGRVLPPEVFYGTDAIVVTVWVRHRPGGQDCQGNPIFPLDIDLTEPLGDRQPLDGSESPPRDATVPPD